MKYHVKWRKRNEKSMASSASAPAWRSGIGESAISQHEWRRNISESGRGVMALSAQQSRRKSASSEMAANVANGDMAKYQPDVAEKQAGA
jgi:hypothetical protein